ncbi:MAG: B12-binding domain-containing protein [Syntrophobacteraceae bacterium]
MNPDVRHQQLITLLTELNEQEVLEEVRRLLKKGEPPLHILESCQKGLRYVGDNYEQGRYYLSGLMMAGEIMRQVSEMLQCVLEKNIHGKTSGRVVLGTVQGDIHDLGKNLVGVILRCHGFELYDLGVDVSPEAFLKGAREFEPHVVGLSGLLTGSWDTMRETIALLRGNTQGSGPRVSTIIGGGMIDEKVFKYVGSDYWAPDAATGAKLCRQLVSGHPEQ